jgi:hypothetical protein
VPIETILFSTRSFEMRVKYKDRDVEIDDIEIEIGEGAWVVSAGFIDTDTDLTDLELDELSEIYQEEIYESAYSNAVNAAHERMEGDR